MYAHLQDWDLHVAAAGQLSPWDGRPLTSERHQNNVWVRRHAEGPWQLDLLVGSGDDRSWRSRRDETVRVPWRQAVLRADGVAYLAPQLQLLMKAKDVRPKDDHDAETVIPLLPAAERRWLLERLPEEHAWQRWARPEPCSWDWSTPAAGHGT